MLPFLRFPSSEKSQIRALQWGVTWLLYTHSILLEMLKRNDFHVKYFENEITSKDVTWPRADVAEIKWCGIIAGIGNIAGIQKIAGIGNKARIGSIVNFRNIAGIGNK